MVVTIRIEHEPDGWWSAEISIGHVLETTSAHSREDAVRLAKILALQRIADHLRSGALDDIETVSFSVRRSWM